jgi:hypothetical protein
MVVRDHDPRLCLVHIPPGKPAGGGYRRFLPPTMIGMQKRPMQGPAKIRQKD